MRLMYLLGLAALLTGCGGGDGDQPQGTKTGVEIFRGHAAFGHEVRTFQPCGKDDILWAVDESGTLWDVHRELAPPTVPVARLFAVVEGQRGPAPADGFGADYPGALQVTRVLYLGLEGPDCDFGWSRFQYQAVGNEPFWSMEVTAGGLVLKRPGEADLAWSAVTRKADGDQLRFVATGDGGLPPVELVIEPGPGRDTMSGSYFGLSARMKLGVKAFRGRALVGAP